MPLGKYGEGTNKGVNGNRTGEISKELVIEGQRPMPLRMTSGADRGYECRPGTHEIAGEGPFTCLACGATFEEARDPWERK